MHPVLRAALLFPIRPADAVASLQARGAALAFAGAFGLAISLLAGLRAGLMAEEGFFNGVRLASSLFGFVAFPAVLLAGGKLLGGRGSYPLLAAALVGAGVPFLLVDGLWIAALGSVRLGADAVASTFGALRTFEYGSWIWAFVLLVHGVARAQAFSVVRGTANVGLLATLGGLAVAVVLALR